MIKKLSIILFAIATLGCGSAFATGNAAAGRGEAGLCAGCHGPMGMSLTGIIPNLAGQGDAYLVKQLQAFRDGTRTSPVMNAVAKGMSDAEIQNLAAYFSSINPTPIAGAGSRFPIPHPPIITSPNFIVPRPHPSMQFWANLMPPGNGRSILVESCQLCHDLQRVAAYAHTKTEWQYIVETMHERGSPVTPQQIPTLVDYLTKNFGLDSRPIAGPSWAVHLTGIKPCLRSQWPQGSADFRRNWKGSYNIWISNMQSSGIDIVDPVTLHIVDHISCISSPDRVEFSRHGNIAYVPDRVENNLTVVNTHTGAIITKIPLIERPNTAVLSRDYKRLYIAIWPMRPTEKSRGYVQVVDTKTLKVVKTIVTKGAIHDTWMSPDRRILLASSPAAKFMNVYDTRTDNLLYSCCTAAEIGTMLVEAGPDGSTWRFLLGYGGYRGIVVIDAKTGKEVERVPYPDIPGTYSGTPSYFRSFVSAPKFAGEGFHGGEISPDGKSVWLMAGNTVWHYSLPELKLLGVVKLAQDDQVGDAFTPKVEGTWLTISPDGKRVYAVRPGRDLLSVIDARTQKEIAEVPTGEYPLHISIWPRGTP